MLGAMALLMLAVVVLSSGRLFQRSYKFVLCFPGDLSGLHVGAPVSFRGVPIGSVKSIRLDIAGMPSPLMRSSQESRIPVIIELDQTQITARGGKFNLTDPSTLEEAVKNGLRGQLRMESYITGESYVSLDMVPGAPLVYCLPKDSGYREIPTIETTLEQAQGTLQRLIAKAEEADLPEMITSASSAMRGINRLVTSPSLYLAVDSLNVTESNLSIAAANLSRAAVSLRMLSDNLDSRLPLLMTTLQSTSKKAETTMEVTDRTLTALQTTIEPASPVVYRLNRTLDDVSGAAHSIQGLADYLTRNPSALIRGRYADSK